MIMTMQCGLCQRISDTQFANKNSTTHIQKGELFICNEEQTFGLCSKCIKLAKLQFDTFKNIDNSVMPFVGLIRNNKHDEPPKDIA